ncbi:MAG: response regulator transcription factor [Alphaproteobacteria bacterium]|nr:response regulator transcription factor [Alphaproteobacteria bacterium]
MTNVIVVEDDADLRDGLIECLRLSGLAASGVGSALEFYQELAASAFDIAVLDVNLPDRDGYSIAGFLAEKTSLGIIFMTGRGQAEDRIRGFTNGADLYFVKPVDPKELVLAITNLARRLGERTGTAEPAITIATGEKTPWVLDRVQWRLIAPSAQTVQLTAKEMQLVERLAAQGGIPVPRNELIRLLGHDVLGPESRGLDATIRRLRRKTLAATGRQLPVQTVQAVGLVFSAPIRFA